MRRFPMVAIVTSAAVVLALLSFVAPLYAQGEQLPSDPNWKPAGRVSRAADGKPDLSGVWWQGHDINFVSPVARGGPRQTFASLYQPWAAERAKTLSHKDDPALSCIPPVDGPQTSDIFQLAQTPKFLVYLQETFHGFRLIPTEPGRKHAEEAVPSFRGDSVGHWEGDTLVVDVTNFSPRNWIFYSVNGPPVFHSDALHVVERYRRTAQNALEVERTYDDPKVLARPWTRPKKVYALAPFDQIMEVVCTIDVTGSLMEAAGKENYGNK